MSHANDESIKPFPDELAFWSKYWRNARVAGIWTASAGSRFPRESFTKAVDRLHFALDGFSKLHGMLRGGTCAVYYGGSAHTLGCSVLDLFHRVNHSDLSSSETLRVEGELDGQFCWEIGERAGKSWFPSAAKLQITADDEAARGDPSQSLWWDFTIRPNIFTKEISIPTASRFVGGCVATQAEWPTAASINRGLVRTLLEQMTNLTATEINETYSEMVMEGMEKYGFSDTPVPRS
jgi:hypothetical protein